MLPFHYLKDRGLTWASGDDINKKFSGYSYGGSTWDDVTLLHVAAMVLN